MFLLLSSRIFYAWPKYIGIKRLAGLAGFAVATTIFFSAQLVAVEIDKRDVKNICTYSFDYFFELFAADRKFRLLHTEKQLKLSRIDVAVEPEPASECFHEAA